EADDQRDLGDVARGADHGLEDLADRVQRAHALGQPGTTGVPDTHDGGLLVDGGVVGADDVGAAVDAHGATHDGAVGGERDGVHAVDGAGGGQDARLVALVQRLDAARVEEGR